MKEKTILILETIFMSVAVIITIFCIGALIYIYGEMMKDHNCYINGDYSTPTCRKYRG